MSALSLRTVHADDLADDRDLHCSKPESETPSNAKSSLSSSSKQSDLELALSSIEMENREQLIKRWRKLFKSTPAKNLSLPMIRRIVGYQLQCKTHGGLSRAAKSALKAPLSAALTASSPKQMFCEENEKHGEGTARAVVDSYYTSKERSRISYLKPESHLIREWNGRTYRVDVKAEGFVMDGKAYKSLTAIAQRITGTRWSGPRFFGLRTRGIKNINPNRKRLVS